MGIIANLFGWFRMSDNNTETPSSENSRPTLGHAYDSRPGWAVRASNSTNEYQHLRPTIGFSSNWSYEPNRSTIMYSGPNDVWSMPTVTGRDARDAINEYLSDRLREDSLWPGTNKKLKHFDAFRDSASELSNKKVNLSADEITKFSSIIATYSALQLPAEEKAKVLQWLANVVEHCSHSTEEINGDDNSVDL